MLGTAPARPPKRSDADRTSGFMADVKAFCAFGRPTEAFEEEGVPYLVNAFWTAAQRQAHVLHAMSYWACFKPQLPAFFIAPLTAPGEGVHDPFMGRGTTPLQAALMGRPDGPPTDRQRPHPARGPADAPAPRPPIPRGRRAAARRGPLGSRD